MVTMEESTYFKVNWRIKNKFYLKLEGSSMNLTLELESMFDSVLEEFFWVYVLGEWLEYLK